MLKKRIADSHSVSRDNLHANDRGAYSEKGSKSNKKLRLA